MFEMQWRRINHAPSLSLPLCGSGMGSSTISRYNKPSFFLFVSWGLGKDSKDQFPPPPNGNRSRNLCSMDLLVDLALEESTGLSETKLHTSGNPSKGSHRRKRMDDGSNSSNLKISKSPKPSIRPEPNPRRSGQYSVFADAAWNSSTEEAGFGWIILKMGSRLLNMQQLRLLSPRPFWQKPWRCLQWTLFSPTVSIQSQFFPTLRFSSIRSRKKSWNLRYLEYSVIYTSYLPHLSQISFNFISRSNNVRADVVAKHVFWTLNPI